MQPVRMAGFLNVTAMPTASSPNPTARTRIDPWLPADPRRRLRTVQTALACLFSVASLLFMAYGVLVDLLPLRVLGIWAVLTVAGGAGFISAVASGWSERLADPSLTVPQMVYAISCCAWAYVATGPMRGAIFTLLMVVMMFGMFAMPIRKLLLVGAYAMAAMGVAMLVLIARRDGVASPMVEAGHLLMLVTMMPAVTMLADRLRHMRNRLRGQKRELAEALERIQFLATRDALTGLVNRGHLNELLARELERHRRCGTRLSVVLLDLDHFKLVNDQHGHGCGDEVLRCFAQRATAGVRACDVLARWGGEEFLLLMPETGQDAALVGAERLRARLAAQPVTYQGIEVPVTLSAGVAEIRGAESIEALIERADQALYAAKAGGRNRVAAALG